MTPIATKASSEVIVVLYHEKTLSGFPTDFALQRRKLGLKPVKLAREIASIHVHYVGGGIQTCQSSLSTEIQNISARKSLNLLLVFK